MKIRRLRFLRRRRQAVTVIDEKAASSNYIENESGKVKKMNNLFAKFSALSKPAKIGVCIAAAVLAVLLIIAIANACIPGYTQEEVVDIIYEQIEPRMAEAAEHFGLKDLSVEIEVVEFTVERKATIFRPGTIWVYINDYVTSPALPDFSKTTQFEDLHLVEFGLQSYDINHDYLLYNTIELDNYFLHIRRDSDYENLPMYRDSEGNEYTFVIQTWDYNIYKNGESVYERPTKPKSESSKGRGCKRCGDTGVALTAGGYCKICIDCYYTDYYVDWDGQISTDRPW